MYAIDDITPLRDLTNTPRVISNYTKGTPFEIAGETKLGQYVYLITKYSIDNGKAQGFDTYELQATDPTKVTTPPVVTPVPIPEKTTDEKQNDRIGAVETKLSGIEALLNKVVEFLQSIFSGFKK